MAKNTTLLFIVTAATTVAAHATPYSSEPLAPLSTAPDGGTRFERLTPEETGLQVPNLYNDPRMWGDRFREFTLGALESGVAVADFDRDGWLDIYSVSKNGPCALYLQVAPFRFRDVAVVSGVAVSDPAGKTGAAAADVNQDGWPDIYLCRYDAPNLLFVNNGDGTFTERGKELGVDIVDASVHASFADYDRDGDIDFYLATNILDFSKSPQGRRDYLFQNDGTGHFGDVTQKSGIWGLTQGHTAIWFDANGDHWPDLYVANDFETPDRFYLNKGDGTFVDVVDQRLPHVTYFSMGADAGDLNNDGLVDYLVADMRERDRKGYMTGMEEISRGLWEMERVPELIPQYMWNAVYLNSGGDHYEEAAFLTGLEATGWTWSPRIADLDLDGRVDAFFTTGMIRNFVDADRVDQQNRAPSLAARANVWRNASERLEKNLAFRNEGNLHFEEVSSEWGLDDKGVSFGCALADFDHDGDLDMVYANFNTPPTVVRNHSTDAHRLVVRLNGLPPNRDGVGAEIRLASASGDQVRQVFTERGIVGSEPPVAHFGLGSDDAVERVTIHWPRGQVQVIENPPVDRLLVANEPPAENAVPLPARYNAPENPAALYAEVAAARGVEHEGTLRPFDEFTRQRLLPRRLNSLGPALAAADVNADGMTDFFVSGSSGQAGVLYLGARDGSFAPAPSRPWADAAEADDLGAVFFDANGDGHPDLFVASGGVQRHRGDALLNDRLYLNDGTGAFKPAAAGVLPEDGESTDAIAAADFDGDGAIDLFVGGRVVPGAWPQTPRSFLFRNEGGRFVDVTDTVAPALREIGMVTDASFADVDGDGRPDLVLGIEWGPVVLLRNTADGFIDHTAAAGLAPFSGWWSALAAADVNGDGRLDIVAGNVGLNTKYRATSDEPTTLFAGDLDGTGRDQLVEAQYDDGQLYPLRGRSKLAYAFPWLSKRFPTFRAYAEASIQDIFGAEALSAVSRFEAAELASGVFLQKADGVFEFQRLPREAQLAPINAIVARDLDGDGALDIYVAGNHFGPEPNTGRFDGSLGRLLKGDGFGHFVAIPPRDSGISVTGEARAAIALDRAGGKVAALVVARSSGPLLLFEKRSHANVGAPSN